MLKFLGISLLVCAVSCGVIFAQAVSQISGTTRDTSGAVVPGVEITATQLGTGAAMAQGDFTAFASQACQGRPVNLGAPYVGNVVPKSLLSPAALNIAAKLPAPIDPCGKFLTGNLVSRYEWQAPVRVDYRLSDKQSVFARYLATKINTVLPYNLSPNTCRLYAIE